jgi:hypothetical protein
MLPVPNDRLLMNLGADPDSAPVPPPNLRLPNHLYNYVPQFTRDLSIALKHSANNNPIRVFMYNLMSSNNWTNEDFRELVNLSLLWYDKLGSNPNEYQNIINDIQALYAAELAVRYPELMNNAPSDLRAAINQNHQQFINLKKEVMMYNRGYPGVNRPQVPQYPQQPQHGYGGPPPQQPLYPQQPPQYGYNNPPPQYPPHPSPMPQYGYGGQRNYNTAPPEDNRSAGNVHAGDGRYGSYADKHAVNNPPETNITEPPATEAYVPDPMPLPGEEFPPLIIPGFTRSQVTKEGNFYSWVIEETEMDRSEHSLIFDNEEKELRELKLDKAAQQLKDAELAKEKSAVEQEINSGVYWRDGLIADASLSGLESEAIINYYKNFDDDNPGIAVIDGMVVKQIITDRKDPENGISNLVPNLFKGTDLGVVARNISKALTSHTGNKNKVAIMKADEMMTNLVNDFIKNQIGLTKLKIDNFSEDYLDLADYLDSKYGNRYGEALRRWDSDVKEVLNSDIDEEIVNYIYGETINETSKIAISPIVIKTNIVVVGAELDDLDLSDLKDGAPKRIMKKVSPMLYNVAEAILNPRTSRTAVVNIMLTVAGQRFKLAKDYLSSNYLIFK